MKNINRALAFILALVFCMGMMSVAMAAPDLTDVSVKGEGRMFSDVGGTVSMQFYVENDSVSDAVIASVTPGNESVFATVELITGAAGTGVTIPAGAKKYVSASGTLKNNIPVGKYSYSSSGAGSNKEKLIFNFDTPSGVVTVIDYTINKQSPEATADPNTGVTEDKEAKLRINPTDANGISVPSPAGNYGDSITVRIPLKCYRSSVSDIKIAPVLSNDVEKFPFDIQAVDYLLTYPNSVSVGGIVEFQYYLRLSKKATVGIKQVDFNVSYRVGGGFIGNGTDNLETITVSVFVNVKKGLSPTSSDSSGSTPKLIVESYSISSDKIYAGETFQVTVTIKNTSSSEDIKNLQIRFKDTAEVAKLVPASGGSNAIYIPKIGRGESKTEVISLQTAPDTEAKAYTLGLDCGYEGSSNNAPYTANETIAIPILQEIRIKCDDPTIYDTEAWVGQSFGMYVRMHNMGKSTIYNCMVDIEGEGLKMEESYFGGNVNSGNTMAADFSVIPSTPGEISGTVVITYEDVYGEAGEERLPFTIFVNEEFGMDPNMGMEGMEGMEDMGGLEVSGPGVERGGMPWWGWALSALVAGGIGTGGFIVLRKKRANSLEDV